MNVTDSTHPTIFMYYYYYQHPIYHQYHYTETIANYNNNCEWERVCLAWPLSLKTLHEVKTYS